ncbi:MAG: methylglyoxal reductase (NADPH-dependent) gre2 [Caeruleum heppii]|nr:MAG: methylglyoxal reductase (NADPH-dependent) gre2 [Caeruleum heppii]
MQSVKDTATKAISTVVDGGTSSGKGQTVLVTGASGFVATHVVRAFLKRGYHVRGTVRGQDSADKVRKIHAQYTDQLTFTIVKDIASPGAFDEAVKNVDGIIHTASPFQTSVEDNERDLLNPAIKGTTEILNAIHESNPKVKRVVITSSFAAILDMSKGARPEHTYTEEDWNPITYDTAKGADGVIAYTASKTLAEKAAFEFVQQRHPNFSIATICPPMVYGPSDHAVENLDHLNTSSADIYRLINGSTKEVPETQVMAFVDVRDVAEAHLRAYECPDAAGQRYFIVSDNYSYQQVVDIIRKKVPELKHRTPEGQGGAPLPETYKVSNEKVKKDLGMTFRSLEETITDTARNLMELEKKTGKRV